MSQYKNLTGSEKEARVQEAAEAYLRKEFSSIRKAAAFHGVPKSTLIDRLAGRLTAWNPVQKQPNLQLLTDAQETALVEWCEDLFSWGFPARYDLLREMAQKLADVQFLGDNWHTRFFKTTSISQA